MKVSLVSLHTSPSEVPGQGDAGGLNVVVQEAAKALSAQGHEVTVFTRASERVAGGEHRFDGAPAVRLVALEAGDAHLRKEHLPGVLTAFGRRLSEHPRFAASDVVHAHYWLSGVAALPAAKKHQIPLAATLHTVGAQKNAHLASGDAPEPPERLEGEATLVCEATVVAGSSSELQGIVSGYGAPVAGGHIVHPGVDTEFFAPPPDTEAQLASDWPLTLTVLGRVQPHKGQDLALDAYADLCDRHPVWRERSQLIIAGEPTPGQEPFHAQLRARATSLGLAVQFLPAQSRDETAALLRRSDLVLVPTHSETFGLVALEAAASGTPVVASRTTGLIEAVSDASGVLVEGRDPAQWAAAMNALLSAPEQRAQLSRSARNHALAHTWQQHANKLIGVYESMRTHT